MSNEKRGHPRKRPYMTMPRKDVSILDSPRRVQLQPAGPVSTQSRSAGPFLSSTAEAKKGFIGDVVDDTVLISLTVEKKGERRGLYTPREQSIGRAANIEIDIRHIRRPNNAIRF